MPQSATIDALDSNGHGLRVVFEQTGDRFAQRLEATARGSWMTLLRSSHDAPLGATARTPLFQEAHEQEIAGVGPVVFLTGASSGDYWSASVQRSAERSARGIDFDVSCRRANDADAAGLAFATPRATLRRTAAKLLEAETDGVSWSLAIEPTNPRAYLTSWEHPWIACDSDAGAAGPCVLRWRFTVRIQ